MRRPVDVSFLDEAEEVEPSEIIKSLPELRQELTPEPTEEELGLRSLLEHPEQFAHSWWRTQASRSRAGRAA